MSMGCSGGGGSGMSSPSPFTLSQWQELEHQALIFKYLMAGMPIPPDLVLPIQKSLESISPRFFHHPTVGYCSFYGKVVDPEPGRCRRTDGKKWRCSKEAYPDSKYCERHMHRGRNRSRKPVESQTATQSSSSVSSLNVSASTNVHSRPLQAFSNASGGSQTHFSLESIPYAIPSKDYRYYQELKAENIEHTFFSEPSGSNKRIQLEEQVENPWPVMHPRVSSFSAKSTDSMMLQSEVSPFSLYGVGDFSGEGNLKQEGQSARPFFDEWPKPRDAWSGLEEDSSNQTSFSTTQLSISIPISSDLSTTNSRSPHDT